MAVVFISPKQRQKTFFIGITAVLVLFLAAVSLMVFLSQPPEVAPDMVFNKPKVSVNMTIFDTDQFKAFQPLNPVDKQFSFVNEQNQLSYISAPSLAEALQGLKDVGISAREVTEVKDGRDNPFIIYYQNTPPTPDNNKNIPPKNNIK